MEARRHSDYYPTPPWCTWGLLQHHPPPAGLEIVEPFAGEGHIVRPLVAAGYRTHAVELRDICRRDLERSGAASVSAGCSWFDLEKQQVQPAPFGAVTNPPFTHAFEAAQSLVSTLRCPYVAMLLRLAFKASRRRAAWNNQWPVTREIVLGARPSFTEDGRTDSYDYAWFVWQQGCAPQPTIVHVPTKRDLQASTDAVEAWA